MAATEFALGSDLAVQRWSPSLAKEAEVKQYFRKFMGTSENSMIMVKKDLSKNAGEKITFALRRKLSGDGVEGDNIIENTDAEEALDFFYDSIFIDQRRKGTKSKGKMTEQRVPYNLRREGRDALSTWFAEDYDQQIIMYLTGQRGIDATFHVPLTWTGRANNTLTAVESTRTAWMGGATSIADVDTADIFSLDEIEQAVADTEVLDPMIQPFDVGGGELKHVILVHPYQAYQLRQSASENDYIDIQLHQKNAGELYKNSLGEYAGCILHKHRNVVRKASGGSADNAAYALFLGAQAGVMAWGGGGAYGRYSWNEEKDDRGNRLAITAGTLYGLKRTMFTDGTDTHSFGVYVMVGSGDKAVA